MKPAEEIKRLFNEAKVTVSSEVSDRIITDSLRAYDNSNKVKTNVIVLNMWRIINIKNKTAKLAIASMIVIGIFGGMKYWGLRVNIATPVFANVIEEINKVYCASYRKTILLGDGTVFTAQYMINEFGVERCKYPQGGIAVYDRRTGKILQLIPGSKKAVITYKVGRDKGKGLINYLDWISNPHEESGLFKGQEEIDGKTVNLFVVEEDYRVTTMWVNHETNLPVRVERISFPHIDKDIIAPKMSLEVREFGGDGDSSIAISRTDTDGVQEKSTVVWSDFIWNPEFEKSLFSLNPPEGYSVEEYMFDVSDKGENDLIAALAFWTEMSEGMFPAKINDLGDSNKVKPMLIEKFDHNGDPNIELKQAAQQMDIMLKGLRFAQKLKVEQNWYYSGKDVQLGNADRPICWWKLQDSDDYRVIYGDLSIGDSSIIPEFNKLE